MFIIMVDLKCQHVYNFFEISAIFNYGKCIMCMKYVP